VSALIPVGCSAASAEAVQARTEETGILRPIKKAATQEQSWTRVLDLNPSETGAVEDTLPTPLFSRTTT